ncbi:glycosyl transferase family 1 [Gordonia sp. 852002-50395_SCH5434458]|uniref:Glycosyltransferase GlgA n=2 Tax=Gordoniaceae TaxID=85026 RepID=H5U0T0_9ACTN|nr:glycogen synthase [Gordonia sputi]OBC03902.1 glycosyl transferase family 1 [Gordonia sp. 852002-50395_SCH5434458]GAB39338.1 glycosyltransferase GlgA [Gordonia sputi NBRC 100414]
MMTREYPPEVYGGAGVHVTELVRHLRSLVTVDVHCMGVPRDDAFVYSPDPALADANPALSMLSTDLRMTQGAAGADIAHSHTWYTGTAGHLAARLYGIPHILTAHSLEPLRPWKAEQLGGGYQVSSWSERNAVEYADAVIAVSSGMRADVVNAYPRLDPERVHVVRNGIDTTLWYPVDEPYNQESTLVRLGVDPKRPVVAFVGRITRQKGVGHLIAAAHHFDPAIQLVLCAGAPDTPEIAAQTEAAVAELAAARDGVYWVREMLPLPRIREILTAADVFVCPSVYEPLGIVNLEAMACQTAVVASAVGGIPEVVRDNVTGRLVPYDPTDAVGFERGIAEAVNDVVGDPTAATAMGIAGSERAESEFSWDSIAEQTLDVYRSTLA